MHSICRNFVVLAFLLTACHNQLTAMQQLDRLVTAAQQLCPKGSLIDVTSAKLQACRRADTCLRPVAAAQHAQQTALLTIAKMEDSADARLAAEAATAGAIASCEVVGIRAAAAAAVQQPASTAPATPATPASTTPQPAVQPTPPTPKP